MVEQGGIKTGRKAVKSQTSLVSLLMRQVVTLLEVFLAAQVGPVQWFSLPLHLPPATWKRYDPGQADVVRQACRKVLSCLFRFWSVKYRCKIGRQVWERNLLPMLFSFPPLLSRFF